VRTAGRGQRHRRACASPTDARRARRLAPVQLIVAAAGVLSAVLLLVGAVTDGPADAQPAPREVRVAVRLLEPFVTKTSDGTYTGFSIDLWEQIARRSNYDTTYVEVGTVGELLDAVSSGKADVAITAISITADRQRTLQFSEPMFNSGLQIAVPASSAHEVGGIWQALSSPAVVGILAFVVLAVILAALVVWAIERRDNPDFAHAGRRGLFESIWWAVVTLLTVGYGDKVTKSIAGRTFSMLFMAFGVLLVACLTATFTATLTVRNLETDVSGASDLAGKKVVTVQGTTSASYLRDHKINAQEVESVDKMLALVRSGDVDAAVYDSPVLAYAAKQEGGSTIRLVGAPITHEYYGIAEPFGSDLEQQIDLALATVYEDGTYNRLYSTWFGES
jgi:ABC-type amino acid transport substrate-binding protein